MNRKAFKTCAVALAAVLGTLLGARPAAAQTSAPAEFPGDWPNLGAYSNRQSRNGDPLTYTSGRTDLRWIAPSAAADRSVLTLDNTDIAALFFSNQTTTAGKAASIDDPLYDAGSIVFSGAWSAPASVTREAGSPYIPLRRNRVPFPTTPTGYTQDLRPRSPAYLFNTCVPSLKGSGDPTIPAVGSVQKYFEWTYTPPTGTDRNYAIYVYLPTGATSVASGATYVRRFPQRYFVYRVYFGPDGPDADTLGDQYYTEVLDTEVSGTGWVRLGNGGYATDRVFPFTTTKTLGATTKWPIRVRLYNTVPRYDDGALAITGATQYTNATDEVSLAASRLVYADATQLRPQVGTFLASPVTRTIASGTYPDGTIDGRVTVARNDWVTQFRAGENLSQTTQGTIISYQSNPSRWPINPSSGIRDNAQEVWRYSLAEEGTNGNALDNGSPGITPSTGWATVAVNPRHVGTNYLRIPVVTDAPTTPTPTPPTEANIAKVTYAPDLLDGDYSLYAYIGGNVNGSELYGRAVQYRIYEGATLVDTVSVDQSAPRLDTATNGGWVRLGTRRYHNLRDNQDSTPTAPLRVVVTNYSTSSLDIGATPTRYAYADAIRFVGTANSAVDSTPVHASVKIAGVAGDPVTGLTNVTIVADESGRIHCLDTAGNNDGTTTEYWSYPSTPYAPDGVNWKDPNIFVPVAGASGIDGTPNPKIDPIDNTPAATMPTSFDLSTAAVARISGADYLYVGASNGRIYCIDMGGRADFDRTTRKIGTTRRIWTFPNDYNPSSPNDPIGSSDLSAFRGSIVFGDANTGSGGVETVYAAARSGRIYALNAVGDTASRTTAQRWQYPTAELPNLPQIDMTPTLFKTSAGDGRLYFGTLRNSRDDGQGRLYCLDATNGNIVWRYNGGLTQDLTDPQDLPTSRRYSSTNVFSVAPYDPAGTNVETFGAFVAGMVAVPAANLDQNKSAQTTGTVAHVDEVYAINSNRFLYAFNAETGAPITYGTRAYATNDLDVLCDTNLTFTFTSVLNRNATYTNGVFTGLETLPIIVVPSTDGRMREAFARTEDYNAFEGYVADGQDVHNMDQGLTSAAASSGALYLGDHEGELYAFDDKGAAGGNIPVSPYYFSGVTGVIPPNDPRGNSYRKIKIRLVNRAAYVALRAVNADGTGGLDFVNATTNPAFQGPTSSPVSPYAFEWGETAYVLVYDFPYSTSTTDSSGNAIATPPPSVRLTLSTDGATSRTVDTDSRKFPILGGSNPPNVEGTSDRADGYAIVPFTFNSSGTTALPPGGGKIVATITTSAAAGGQSMAVLQDTRAGSPSNPDATVAFQMANPLAVVAFSEPTSLDPGHTKYGYGSIGETTTANDPSNLVNGSPDVVGTTSVESQILASAGFANHGGSATAQFAVVDRSLMALVRPEGLNNVRVARSNLERQGGAAGVYRPLSQTLYPAFEDLPVRRPNVSLDYPNVGREQVRVAKDPAGSAENPVLTTVSLRSPTYNGKALSDLTDAELDTMDNKARVMQRTPFELTIDVPRYQPPVFLGKPGTADAFAPVGTLDDPTGDTDNPNDLLRRRRNSNGFDGLPEGYFGRVQVFVDSQADGVQNTGTLPEAFRAFNYTLGVSPQTSILVGTPTLDLGSLAGGTGYAPKNPYAAGALGVGGPVGPFNPWAGAWADEYQPITVRNDGNVNLVDLRVLKATNEAGTTAANKPWTLDAKDNDPLAWMGATLRASDGTLQPGDLWSNIDTTFAARNAHAPTFNNLVVLPKPRVTDRAPSDLEANPYPRANPNLRIDPATHQLSTSPTSILVNGSPTNAIQPGLTPSLPKVGVSVPPAFPVGNYSTQVYVVENVSPVTGLPVDDDILNYYSDARYKAYEAYSDPITVTWKVRETRVTNRTTPRTAPMMDDPSTFPNLPTGWPYATLGTDAYKGKFTFRNAAPAGMRDKNGNVVLAFESDRDTVDPLLTKPNANNPSRLYLGKMSSGAGQNDGNAPAFNPPLWDLYQFGAGGAQWFAPATSGGFPDNATAAGLFDVPTSKVVTSTMRFGSPSFPQQGPTNPLAYPGTGMASTYDAVYMGFVGEAQVLTDTGRLTESRVFLSTVTPSNMAIGAPKDLGGDPQTTKGKPSVVQLSTGPLVFYSETSAGQSGITVSRLLSSGAVATTRLNFGPGFSSVLSPSANARQYLGDRTATGINAQMIDLSFAGKVRGRPNAELYLGRLRLDTAPSDADPNAYQLVDTADASRRSIESGRAGSPWASMPQQTSERLVNEGSGVFRARGVAWSRRNVKLEQTVLGTTTNLLVGAAAVDRQSGLIAYDSSLGGKVYLDPELGTVKFVGSQPGRNSELRLTYTPTFLRVSPGGASAYSAINGLWDDRYVSEYDTDANGVFYPYWFKGDSNTKVRPSDLVRNDRYYFAYGRSAAGATGTARPYSTSMRLGVRLPTRIATDANGNVVSVKVTGATRPFQVDPANGRIYFQAEDEDRQISILYTGVNEATDAQIANIQVPPTGANPIRVSFVLERAEAQIPVDEAANDSALTAFLDPFNLASDANNRHERPPLVWMFYTSTRAGAPDVYFQTVAPRFMPFAK